MSYNPTLIYNGVLLAAGDMSAPITTPSHDVSQANSLAVQAVWTGASSPIGAMSMEMSTDNINFTIDQDSTTNISGDSGSVFYNIQDIGYRWIRLVYTPVSGSGTLLVNISSKFV